MKSIIELLLLKMKKIIAIVGPTASGKTDLAIKIAKKFSLQNKNSKFKNIAGAEIVSADSRQIYKDMDIGVAKPKRDKGKKSKEYISNGIIHHMIDIKRPDEDYSVAEYKKEAIKIINDILNRGKIPIFVGGTGLYIKAVLDNLTIPEAKANNKLRKKMEEELNKKGLQCLSNKLIKLDPKAKEIVDLKNPRRVIRALEIIETTGNLFSETRKSGPPLFDAIRIGICPEKNILEKRIAKRTKDMLNKNKSKNIISETKKLIKKYGKNNKIIDSIGYREIIDYLNKSISLQEAENQINKHTIDYAKRQMTWFKKDKNIKWIKDPKEAFKII